MNIIDTLKKKRKFDSSKQLFCNNKSWQAGNYIILGCTNEYLIFITHLGILLGWRCKTRKSMYAIVWTLEWYCQQNEKLLCGFHWNHYVIYLISIFLIRIFCCLTWKFKYWINTDYLHMKLQDFCMFAIDDTHWGIRNCPQQASSHRFLMTQW